MIKPGTVRWFRPVVGAEAFLQQYDGVNWHVVTTVEPELKCERDNPCDLRAQEALNKLSHENFELRARIKDLENAALGCGMEGMRGMHMDR